jgi:peptidoglycan/LPS O-acetylase OafA/YrhL
MNIDWKRKLTSRKFWAMLAGVVAAILLMCNVGDNQVAQVVSILGMFGTIAAYIFGESQVDAAYASNQIPPTNEE